MRPTRHVPRGLSDTLGFLLAIYLCAPVLAAPPRRARHHAKPKSTVHAASKSSVPTKHASPPSPAPTSEDLTPSTMPVSDYLQVGWWRGDGSGADETRQNNGSPTDGVGYARAVNGRGFRFAGRDDAVIVRDSPSLTLTRSFTINVWVNVDVLPTPDDGKSMILFRGDDRGGLDPYTLYVDTKSRLFFRVESETESAEISAPLPGHCFVMVTAFLDDSTGRMDLYENTVLVARTITSVRPLAQLDPGQHPAIGIGNCNALPGSGYRFPFHGIINNLRIWQRVLAPGEIQSLYGGS